MLTFVEGNLLRASTEALVNTVNEVGVMGKGIALMFREAYPANNAAYEDACKRGEVRVGKMFVYETGYTWGPKWIINFPTKRHWRNPSRIEWVREGLDDLVATIKRLGIRSVAVPPLGCGNGGLHWAQVKELITAKLESVSDVDVQVFSPTKTYQNTSKVEGSEKLTPARAMIVEMIRRYSFLGFECSLLEIQKLAWFLERGLKIAGIKDPLKLKFEAGKYGPYTDTLRHLLDGLDGSYLHSTKRIADATRHDIISFADEREPDVTQYLHQSQMTKYSAAIEWAQKMIEGFESPFGMELLATVDWLISHAHYEPSVASLREGLASWPHSSEAASRKVSLFDDRVLSIALNRVLSSESFIEFQPKLSL